MPTHPSLELVVDSINEGLSEPGLAPTPLAPAIHILHDAALDSMGLAMVVLKLEEKTGREPFIGGFVNFHTVGELAALYGA